MNKRARSKGLIGRVASRAIGTAGLIALLAQAAACGGTDGPSRMILPDANNRIDATPGDPTADAAPVQACTVLPEGYGDLGVVNQGNASIGPQNATPTQDFVAFALALNDDQDVITFSLWEGFSTIPADFTQAVYPITVAIQGDERVFATCGACLQFSGDVVDNTPTQNFMAQSGTVVIDALDPTPDTGRITGSITGVVFAHVDDEDNVIDDGCTTTVDALAFDLALVQR